MPYALPSSTSPKHSLNNYLRLMSWPYTKMSGNRWIRDFLPGQLDIPPELVYKENFPPFPDFIDIFLPRLLLSEHLAQLWLLTGTPWEEPQESHIPFPCSASVGIYSYLENEWFLANFHLNPLRYKLYVLNLHMTTLKIREETSLRWLM